MKVFEIIELLQGELITGEELLDTEITSACGSDMMSDVLSYVKNQGLLLTGLTNPQSVRTAEMMDMHCIVFVRGKKPDQDTIRLAKERDIILIATSMPMFQACGLLYKNGVDEGLSK